MIFRESYRFVVSDKSSAYKIFRPVILANCELTPRCINFFSFFSRFYRSRRIYEQNYFAFRRPSDRSFVVPAFLSRKSAVGKNGKSCRGKKRKRPRNGTISSFPSNEMAHVFRPFLFFCNRGARNENRTYESRVIEGRFKSLCYEATLYILMRRIRRVRLHGCS